MEIDAPAGWTPPVLLCDYGTSRLLKKCVSVSSALAPFNLPHDGRCVCAECPWGKWCNYCIMQMEPRAHELILINRKRPSAPIFLSRDEAVMVAQGLAQAAPAAKFVPCIKDFVMGEGGTVMAWPEPDTHDEWRKLNEGE